MTIDDYKELMRFHILMSDFNLSEYKYAAVDYDGSLFVYTRAPALRGSVWILYSFSKINMLICEINRHEKWQDTLITL